MPRGNAGLLEPAVAQQSCGVRSVRWPLCRSRARGWLRRPAIRVGAQRFGEQRVGGSGKALAADVVAWLKAVRRKRIQQRDRAAKVSRRGGQITPVGGGRRVTDWPRMTLDTSPTADGPRRRITAFGGAAAALHRCHATKVRRATVLAGRRTGSSRVRTTAHRISRSGFRRYGKASAHGLRVAAGCGPAAQCWACGYRTCMERT